MLLPTRRTTYSPASNVLSPTLKSNGICAFRAFVCADVLPARINTTPNARKLFDKPVFTVPPYGARPLGYRSAGTVVCKLQLIRREMKTKPLAASYFFLMMTGTGGSQETSEALRDN